jgi:recombination protein RecA
VERKQVKKAGGETPPAAVSAGGGNYFSSPKTNLKFISSGSKLLDLALGGGWCEGRISNIVGDKSSGKTLLAIEASANFHIKYPDSPVHYREAESAFDEQYARALGFPTSAVDFGRPLETVEDLFEDLEDVMKTSKKHGPILYIVDSLDALTDRSEIDREIDKGTFGAGKAKQMSQLFRRQVRQLSENNVHLMIISQVRDNIGSLFNKVTRSGGRALDFYASQVLMLAQLEKEKQTIRGIERVTGLVIRGRVEKNKIALPWREAEFRITMGYGVDDVESCIDWLKKAKRLKNLNVSDEGAKDYLKSIAAMDDEKFIKERERVHAATEAAWYELETEFMPKRTKYRIANV